MTLEAGSEHESPEEGSKIVLEADPETERLGKNVAGPAGRFQTGDTERS